jgi:hypothetical protein
MSLGIYLFCLTPAVPRPEIAGTGIDGEHPLFIEVIGEVAAVLAEVNIEDFSGPEAQEKMEDLKWVAPRALRHEEVVLSAMEQGPVLPVRFGTVFSSLAAAAEPLRQRQDVLMKFFQDTIDKKEWTLKGYVGRPQARARMTAARLAAEKEQLAGLSPGKRYFLEQKIKGAVDKDVAIWLKEMERDILSVVKKMSVGFSECRLQSQDVTDRDEEMFFHGALLVPDASMADLQRLLSDWNAAHQDAGLLLELSGPWPPYHFAPTL